jgi:hypothetical protein
MKGRMQIARVTIKFHTGISEVKAVSDISRMIDIGAENS